PWIFIHGYPLTVPLGLAKCVRFQPQKISIGVTFTSLESRVLSLLIEYFSFAGRTTLIPFPDERALRIMAKVFTDFITRP
ncbi:MAG: hypothetical protein LAT55_10705, partial [Opitutales bacterium]|nr:hypothetical protein [Opitutales bacterium]